MSEHSKFPVIHQLMEQIPYPGTPWHEVITTEPAFDHLHWAFVFAILSAVLQIFCYILTKLFAPILIGYSSTPPLPNRLKLSKDTYVKLGEAVNYTQSINIKRYDLNELSATYCNSKLTAKEVEKYLKFCNRHHAEISKNEQRFQECLFPIFTKVFTLGLGFYAVYDKSWLYHRAEFYHGWPNQQGLDCCMADVKLLYIVHIGWYIYKLFGQTFLDRHLKDFMASLIHHCTTICLMSLSYSFGLQRAGIAVLLLHDPADIILNFGKLMRLIHQTLLLNLAFVLLVFAWFATRVVVFPYHCMLSGFIDFYEQHGNKNSRDDMIIAICCIMMCALYVLHLHWFWLIVKAVLRTLSGHGIVDSRSDNEDEDDSDKNEPDKSKKTLK